MALTKRQHRFVEEYTVDFNATQAAIRAGYSSRSARQTASEILTYPDVKEAIQKRQAHSAQKFEIRREQAVQGILNAIDLAIARQNPQAQIAGWKEIGKMLGFYEVENHTVVMNVAEEALRAQYEAMTDEELLQLTKN